MGFSKKRIYMDFASATPLHAQVKKEMVDTFALFGNPSAPHEEGRRAKEKLESARVRIARTLGVKSSNLFVTGSGTESNNLALFGFVDALIVRGAQPSALHIITSGFEHPSADDPMTVIEKRGVRVTRVLPNEEGVITPERVREHITPQTVLVSIVATQSEIGVVQPLKDIATMLADVQNKRGQTTQALVPETALPVFHTDASQSPLFLDLSPERLGVGMASYDAQKCMGPKGVGLLYKDSSIPLEPFIRGGKQERGIRPGTENVVGVAGMARAFELSKEKRKERVARVSQVRDFFFELLEKEVPEAEINGSKKKRIANNVHISLPNTDGDYLAVLMDKKGIAVSPRSACIASGVPSRTVVSLGKNEASAIGTLRFTLSPDVSKKDVRQAIKVLKKVIAITTRGI